MAFLSLDCFSFDKAIWRILQQLKNNIEAVIDDWSDKT